jgi:hypothetical protein
MKSVLFRLCYAAFISLLCIGSAQAETEPVVNIREKLKAEILAPRVYGIPGAPIRAILIHSPTSVLSQKFMIKGLPSLMQLVEQGKVQLEIRTYSHNYINTPVGLMGRCLDGNVYPIFLVYAAKNHELLKKDSKGFNQALAEAVLENENFWPQGYDKRQAEQRLTSCRVIMEEFLLAQEVDRLQMAYNYRINIPEIAPTLIVITDQGATTAEGFKSFSEISRYFP